MARVCEGVSNPSRKSMDDMVVGNFSRTSSDRGPTGLDATAAEKRKGTRRDHTKGNLMEVALIEVFDCTPAAARKVIELHLRGRKDGNAKEEVPVETLGSIPLILHKVISLDRRKRRKRGGNNNEYRT